MDRDEVDTYKVRFENLLRVAKKITSSLNIGDILEMIRDEVKTSIPAAQEACLILVDPEAPAYTRPLHCVVRRDQVNCHSCKRGKEIVGQALDNPSRFHCHVSAATGVDPHGQDSGQDDPPGDRELPRPQGGGGLLGFPIEGHQHRLHGAHRERQRHEDQRQRDADRRIGDVDAQWPLHAVERQ